MNSNSRANIEEPDNTGVAEPVADGVNHTGCDGPDVNTNSAPVLFSEMRQGFNLLLLVVGLVAVTLVADWYAVTKIFGG